MARVHIIGAGLAGLAAAVRLSAAGHRVALYEAAGRAGGRCRSFHDDRLGCIIDNGNHLLLSGNRSALAYLAEIGAADRLSGPGDARFPFLDLADGTRWTVTLPNGRLPFWLLNPARHVPGTRIRDWLRAVRLFVGARHCTVAERLDPQSTLFHRLWEPLTVAALNLAPEKAAASLLARVLRETFVRGGRHCRPLVARASLADTFIDPALATLRAAGADIRFHARLTGLELGRGAVQSFTLGAERIAVGAEEAVLLAVPPRIARTLVPDLAIPDDGEAIVNVHYRLPSPAAAQEVRVIGLVGGLSQWVFVRGEVASVTISAADRVAAMPAARIAAICWREVARALEIAEDATPPHRVIKEKRATFAATPASLKRRPGSAMRWHNLALAGDWTATGLPATIESAIRSGHKAAQLLDARLRHRPASLRLQPSAKPGAAQP